MQDLFLINKKRIVLQAFEPDNIPRLHSHLNHPGLVGRRYLPEKFSDDLPLAFIQVEAILKAWEEKQDGFNLAVIAAKNRELIGHINCDWSWDTHCPDVSVIIYPEFQRQGYGTEGLQSVLGYLFQTSPAHNISGWIADWNLPARHFAEKMGFKESGMSRREHLRNGAYSDSILVDILKEEWQRKER